MDTQVHNPGMETESVASSNSPPHGSWDANNEISGPMIHPIRRNSQAGWTLDEDHLLAEAVHRYGGSDWTKIAECMPTGRTNVQCLYRWQTVLNPELVKGTWTKEEDNHLIQLVNEHGPSNWSTLAKSLPGRMGKQCRERWFNNLDPTIYKGEWTKEEDNILRQCHNLHGNKWAKIAGFLPGRTANCVKNHWNSYLRKRLSESASSSSAQMSERKIVTLFGVQIAGPQNNISSQQHNCRTTNFANYLNNFQLNVGRGGHVSDYRKRSNNIPNGGLGG